MSSTIARRSRSRNDNKSNGESYEREIETRERNIRFTGGTKISVRQLLAATLYRFLIVIARKLIKLTITIGTTGQTVLVNNVACVIRAWCLRLRAYVYSSYIRSYRGYRTYVHTYVFAMRYPGAYDNTMYFLAKRRTRSARNWNRDEGKEGRDRQGEKYTRIFKRNDS